VFNFTAAEQIASFAAANDFTMRCHTLVWHSQLAPFVASLSGTALQSAMENHIVMGPRFSLPAWQRVLTRASCSDDAVPQPLLRVGRRERGAQRRRHVPHLAVVQRPRPGLHHHRLHHRAQRQGCRRQALLRTFRTHFARDAGADADVQNDYNTEGINAKSDALYKIAKALKKKKLIDGIGFQSHFIIGEVPTTLQANLQRFADLGLEVALTELDIRVRDLVAAGASPQSLTWIYRETFRSMQR
jgi:endo-1,4-beta-xylanase